MVSAAQTPPPFPLPRARAQRKFWGVVVVSYWNHTNFETRGQNYVILDTPVLQPIQYYLILDTPVLAKT